MIAALVTGLMLAAPTASSAEALAKSGQWEELYLAFAATPPRGFSRKDTARIGSALARGCSALLPSDAVLAFSLGARALEFASAPAAIVCTAQAALKTDQRTEAAALLRWGLGLHPKDGLLALELGRLLLEDGDATAAADVLATVPRHAAEYSEASTLFRRAQAIANQAPAVDPRRERGAQEPLVDDPPIGQTYESGVDEQGRRVRQNAFFRIRYYNAQRDFGQRADYEGQVQDALGACRDAARRLLGVSRERPVEVILFSKSEFAAQHGALAATSVAGFYWRHAISLNDSAEINPRNTAALVHEYVHSVVDELAGFNGALVPRWVDEGVAEWVQWQYEGRSRPEGRSDSDLRQRAAQRNLPRLAELADAPFLSKANPQLLYAYAAIAIGTFIDRWGMPPLLSLIRDVGRGVPFEEAFPLHTRADIASFEESVAEAIKLR